MTPEKLPRMGVAIMARVPIPGQAKTRLIPVLGAAGAAALQGWLLRRTVAMALAANIGPVSLWFAGDSTHPAITLCRTLGSMAVRQQAGDDLGARMLLALHESATPDGALVIGTDCPAMTAQHLRQAAQALQGQDAVVCPAEDGGYVLIGMRTAAAAAFSGIDWGTEHVMAQTRQKLRDAGCRWAEPLGLWDVDRPDDLQRLFALYPDARTAGNPGGMAA